MELCKSGTEFGEQTALMQWVRYHTPICYELSLLFAIPNGGARNPVAAARAKAEGVRPGVSDLMLPVARHGKYGLWLEMKKLKGGRESDDQKEWGKLMRENGYAYYCAHGWQDAARCLMAWLEFREKPWHDGSVQSEAPRAGA